jgi:hypothetical protein
LENGMPFSDEELAQRLGVSATQAEQLRLSRGVSSDTLGSLPTAAVRRAIRRLDYPDLPLLRDRFRLAQEVGDDGRQAAAGALARALDVRDELRTLPPTGPSLAGVPVAQAGAPPAEGPAAGLNIARWEWLGPGNIGGRTLDLVIDPRAPARMWAATAGGGVWHTEDGGAHWQPVDDFMANLACTCLAIDPTNPDRIYVGTGEGFGSGDAIRGSGIFTTTDTVSWSRIPATSTADFQFVNRLALSDDGSVVLAATNTGIFRSDDAGRQVWTKVLAGRVGDVQFDPADPSLAVAGANGAGEAWFSNDGGRTWVAAAHGPWAGRVELVHAAHDPSVVYASVQATHGEIWRSSDGGRSYQRRQTVDMSGMPAPYLGDQGWYDNVIWAGDPTDADLVVVGGINLWRSTDGGDHLAEISTWSDPRSAHADQHVIVAHPAYDGTGNRTVFFGNDGGLFCAPDLARTGTDAGGAPFVKGWKKLVNGYGITQFYSGAANSTSGKIVGGAQDNGTVCFDPATGTGGWTTIFGGDGGCCAADPTDPAVFYGEYVFLNLHRNTDGGSSNDTSGNRYISGQFWNTAARKWDWKPVPFRIPDAMTQNALFIAPFVLDPNQPQRILAGGLSLWRSDDAKTPNTPTSGPQWRAIKPSAGSEISALAVARTDSDVVWVGHRNGAVFRTLNGTSPTPTWDRVGAAGPAQLAPRRYCTRITIHPADADTVYVAFGGYEVDNVWVTRNGGATWAGPTSMLPAAPIRAVAVHPRRHELLYLGSEVGLFASEDRGVSWFPTNDGPTNCSVDDLLWMDETLVCVTHGRGMFRIDLSGV